MKSSSASVADERTLHEFSILRAIIQLAWRRRLVLLFTLAGFAFGVAMAYLLPVKYTSQAKVMMPQASAPSAAMLLTQSMLGAGSSISDLAQGGLSLRNPNAIYVGMLNSRTVADAVIQRFNLRSVYHAADMTAARVKLAMNTEIVSESDGFISISVTDSDRMRAVQIANGYIDALRGLMQNLSSSAASDRKLFYEQQLHEENDALTAAEIAFQRVQQAYGLVEMDAQTKSTIESLAAIQAQITAKQVALQSLRTYSTERNPQVEIAERELASLEAQESRLNNGRQGGSEGELALHDLSGAGLEYARAEHEVKYRQTLMDLLIRQYDAARLDEAKGAPMVQVVEPPLEPERRSSPHRLQIVATATFFGFFLACLWVMLLWWKETLSVRTEIVARLAELRDAFSK